MYLLLCFLEHYVECVPLFFLNLSLLLSIQATGPQKTIKTFWTAMLCRQTPTQWQYLTSQMVWILSLWIPQISQFNLNILCINIFQWGQANYLWMLRKCFRVYNVIEFYQNLRDRSRRFFSCMMKERVFLFKWSKFSTKVTQMYIHIYKIYYNAGYHMKVCVPEKASGGSR